MAGGNRRGSARETPAERGGVREDQEHGHRARARARPRRHRRDAVAVADVHALRPALEAAKNGKPSARVAAHARTMGAVSGGTCMTWSSGSANAANPIASTAPTKKLVVVAAVATRRVVAAAAAASAARRARVSENSEKPSFSENPSFSPGAARSASRAFVAFAAAFATAVVTTTDIAKHISAANAKSDDEGASAAR